MPGFTEYDRREEDDELEPAQATLQRLAQNSLAGDLNFELDPALFEDNTVPLVAGDDMRPTKVSISQTTSTPTVTAQGGSLPPYPPNEAADHIQRADTTGGRLPNTYGYDDERRVANLYEERKRVPELWANANAQPDPHTSQGMGRYEKRYRFEHGAPDRDLLMLGALAGLTGGQQSANNAVRLAQQQQQLYDEGLWQSRQADAKYNRGPRVDQATAEMLVLAGVSPEAAVQAHMNDTLVQRALTGSSKLGDAATNQQLKYATKELEEIGKTLRHGQGIAAGHEDTQTKTEATIEAARLKAAGKKGGAGGGAGGGGKTPEAMAAQLRRDFEMDPARLDDIIRFVQGAPPENAFTPAESAALRAQLVSYQPLPPKKWNELVTKSAGAIDASGNREVAADANAERQKGLATFKAGIMNADKQLKFKIDARSGWADATAAARGLKYIEQHPEFRKMFFGYAARAGQDDPQGLLSGENFVKWIRQQGYDPETAGKLASAGGAIWRAVNTTLKARSGAAVTNGEWARAAREIGVPVGWDPGNAETGAAQMRSFLGSIMKDLEIRRRTYNETVVNDRFEW